MMSEREQFLANFEQEFKPLPRWTPGDIVERQNELTERMLELELYRKLAEVVMYMDVNKTHFTYKVIGSLREKLEARLATQKAERILGDNGVLKDIKNLVLHGITVTQVASELKWHISRKIQREVDMIDGFKHIFRAIFTRERQQALNNQKMMGLQDIRDLEQADIDQIQAFYDNELTKRGNLLQVLLYVLRTDFLRLVTENYETLVEMMSSGTLLAKEILRTTPPFTRGTLTLPISTLEDVVSLVDSHTSV